MKDKIETKSLGNKTEGPIMLRCDIARSPSWHLHRTKTKADYRQQDKTRSLLPLKIFQGKQFLISKLNSIHCIVCF